MNPDYENEVHEDFEVGTVCNTLKYNVNVLGYEVNVWVLLLVVAVVLGVVWFQGRHNRFPTLSDISLSSTSSMADIAKQMGGYSINTPSFIRNL